jgi:Fatty acid/phospholipid biosynthesis enzyme
LIDAGANTNCEAENLVEYAIMGAVYSKRILGVRRPTVGLMSIGGEDAKGTDLTKEAFKLLKQSPVNFRGNIEGHDLFEKPVEVVVCDGFVGNVILKTCEAIAHAIFTWLKHELKKNPKRVVGAAMAKGAFQAIHKKTNWEDYGGSPLLGVNGICIIAHGASTPLAIKNAIRVAAESIEHQVNPHIIDEVQRYHETTTSLEPAIR